MNSNQEGAAAAASGPRRFYCIAANFFFWMAIGFWVLTQDFPERQGFVIYTGLISTIAFFLIFNPYNLDPFEPIKLFAYLYGFGFGIGPLLLAPDGAYEISYFGIEWASLLDRSASIAFYGFLAALMGYYGFAIGKKNPHLISHSAVASEPANFGVLLLGGGVLFVIGLGSFLILVAKGGGLQHFATYTGGRADIFGGTFGGYFWGTFFMVSGISAIGVALVRRRPFTVLLLGLIVGSAYSLFQGRDQMIGPIICSLVIVNYGYRQIKKRWLVLAAIALFFLASMMGYYRSFDKDELFENPTAFVQDYFSETELRVKQTIAKNLEQLDALAIAVRYVQKTNRPLRGRTMTNWLEPLDRNLFGGVINSIHAGHFMVALVNPELRWARTALSPSLPGELYLNFRLGGVLIGMFVMGAVLRIVFKKLIDNSRSNPLLLMMVPYPLWMVTKTSIDGLGLLFKPVTVIFPLLFLYVIAVFLRKPEPTPDSVKGVA